MVAKQRIALYGGTFDPVHVGHLEVARKVSELFEIEKVLFVPAQIAPHKVGRTVTAPLHRYAMLALATQHDRQLSISTFELDAPDRRYTVNTLEHFLSVFGASADLFFIMGADSWTEIATWWEWERLLVMVNHIVVTRPGYDITAGPQIMNDRVVDLRSGSKAEIDLDSNRIYLTDIVFRDVSATRIRSLVEAGQLAELAQLVSEPVAGYISKYGLYRKSHEV
ncbi:MAG TPA: nicotinate-nucleotide adenylyltransferase [Pyrinomonadaceae bacterium]